MPSGVYKRKLKPLHERFWSNVEKKGKDECWEWVAYRQPNGYGQMMINKNL